MLLASIVSAVVKTDGGNTLIREVKISTRGGTLSGVLYIPKDALENDGFGNYTSPRPAVILSHGYLNSNQMQDPNAIELSRRGFVVFAMDMYGHGNSDLANATDDPTGSGAVLGALDAYNYVRTLPYVDATRIGIAGHSMGGMNTGNAVALAAGFYTEADMLLNLLHDEFGMDITAEQVAAQDPDALAAGLSDYERGQYELRREEILTEAAQRPVAELFMGSGPGFAGLTKAHQVEVAGNTVWRDLQANVGVSIGLYEENCWLMFSASDDGINSAKQIPETTVARVLFGTLDAPVERETWYSLNLSDGGAQLESTKLGSFYSTEPSDTALREAIANRSARVMIQPAEIHAGNHFSFKTTSFVVQFFTDVMNYNNGELADGAQPIPASSSVWLIKELANGVALAAMLALVYPFAALLLEAPFFAGLRRKPREALIEKNDRGFWIISVLLAIIQGVSIIPCFILGGAPTTYAGDKGPIAWNWLFSQEMPNRTIVWALTNAAIALLLLLIRHLRAKSDKLSFADRYGIKISAKDFGKTVLLALIVFAGSYCLAVLSSFFFARSDFRLWVIAGRVMTKTQFLTWAGYLVFFLVFYIVNSMVVNSGRMRNMSDGKNLLICALFNVAGVFVFELFVYAFELITGQMVWYGFGKDYFLYAVVLYPMIVVLPLAAVYARKLYNKTGSAWLGALINAMIFTWFVVGNTCYHYSMLIS